MEIDEIIERLEWFSGKFEREAVEAAVANRDEIIPELLTVLEEIADPEIAADLNSEGDYMAHLYAMFLLAQFRETRAYPLMLRIASHPSDLLDSLFGDSLTENFGAVLASVCGGDIAGMQALIENPAVNEWVRGAALGALATLVAAGIKSREEIVGYFASLFHGGLSDTNDVVWSDLVVYSTDLCAAELLPEIEKAYERGLADPGMIGLSTVRHELAKGVAWAMEQLASDRHRKLIDDTVKEMGWWATFDEEEQKRWKTPAPALTPPLEALRPWQPDSYSGYKRSTPKVGRNDPCPCGSGTKYKKCCGG